MEIILDKWKEIRNEGLKQIKYAPELNVTRNKNPDMKLPFEKHGWVRGWTNDPKWLNYGIFYNNLFLENNGSFCPETSKVAKELSKNYDILMLGYSLLKPHGEIPNHKDFSHSNYKIYHLGLSIPDPEKCVLQVGKKKFHHKDGEILNFDDNIEHYAYNKTNRFRLILYIKLREKN